MAAHPPSARSRRLCEPHLAKHGQARGVVARARPCGFAKFGLRRIANNGEMVQDRLQCVSQEPFVDRGKTLLGNLTAFSLRAIGFRAISRLAGA